MQWQPTVMPCMPSITLRKPRKATPNIMPKPRSKFAVVYLQGLVSCVNVSPKMSDLNSILDRIIKEINYLSGEAKPAIDTLKTEPADLSKA